MKIDIRVPEVGESVQEAVLARWYAKTGDVVRRGQVLFLIETDKVTLEIAAEADGVLQIRVHEGETIPIGAVVGTLETEAVPEPAAAPPPKSAAPPQVLEAEALKRSAPETPVPPQPAITPPAGPTPGERVLMAPSAKSLVEEHGLDISRIQPTGPGGRITRGDVLLHLEAEGAGGAAIAPRLPLREEEIRPSPAVPAMGEAPRAVAPPLEAEGPLPEPVTRKPMSLIRQRIAERLLASRQNTATLTTFNDIDMSRLQALRRQFKESYREKYGVPLGIMSFFVKACVAALKEFPEVNAFIDGKEIVFHHYYHIGVAVGAERGLVVPVIRHADRLGFDQIERAIVDFVVRIRENRLQLSDLEGGTFTITNGGVFGSLLSTPLLNTPQSAILGMHRIEDRPVAVGGQVVVRPMMYVALSYDHRIIDGREAVGFLKRIKECIENPERMMLEI